VRQGNQSITCLSLVPLTGRFYSGKIGLEEEVRVATDDHNDHTATRAVAVYNTKKVKVCSVSMNSVSPAAPPAGVGCGGWGATPGGGGFAFAAPMRDNTVGTLFRVEHMHACVVVLRRLGTSRSDQVLQ
jgi:hypothetical protein